MGLGFGGGFESAVNPLAGRRGGFGGSSSGGGFLGLGNINPLVGAGLLGFGGDLLGGLAGLIGGGGQRRRQRDIFNQLGGLSSQLGAFQGRLDPRELHAQSVVASQPLIERFGRQLDERFGFDQGRAGGELSRLFSEQFGALMPRLQRQSAQFDFNALLNAARIKAQQGQFV